MRIRLTLWTHDAFIFSLMKPVRASHNSSSLQSDSNLSFFRLIGDLSVLCSHAH